MNNNIPLPRTKVIYLGEENELHKHGETYTVIETGLHWIKEFGFCVWVTTEEDKETKDIDYGMGYEINSFNKDFKIH